jgi:hypothetical protein
MTQVTTLARLLAATVAFGCCSPAMAWIYPEHRDIAVLAVQGLDPAHRELFDQLWDEARSGDEQRMCAEAAVFEQGLAPSCIDWAALSGIAGDHACSSQEMLETVRTEDWILVVADIAAQLKSDLARISATRPPATAAGRSGIVASAARQLADAAGEADRTNALRVADTRLQRADKEYATRAGANLAHFMIARPDTNLDPKAYAALALRPGSDLNAAGVYAWYHASALQKASRLGQEPGLSTRDRNALARSALYDEAFALHFLEDMYAAGHVAGSWGDVAQRMGTHDFYNRIGLEVFTWQGRDRTVVLTGDAHMRPQDAEYAARTVTASLEQVLDAASGTTGGYVIPGESNAAIVPDGFDTCTNVSFPYRDLQLGTGTGSVRTALRAVMLDTPVPGLGPGLGAQPRMRSELGPFVGLAGAIDARGINGGFLDGQTSNGAIAGLDLGIRAGYGLEGALGQSSDGLMFAQLGLRADSPSSSDVVTSGRASGGSLTAAIPARTAVSLRLRAPYYLIPGDLVLLSPMYLVSPDAYTAMALTAANGGLFGLQHGWATPIGRFQFVLGRELGVNFYGLFNKQQLLMIDGDAGVQLGLVNFKSVSFDMPVLEYRAFRAFSSDQSSEVFMQLFVAADVPYSASLESSGASVDLNTVWSVGLRLLFDWRNYW